VTLRIDSLRVRLIGVNPSRAPVIARLLAAELAAIAPGVIAGEDPAAPRRVEDVAAPPLPAHPSDSDATIASRLAHAAASQIRTTR
jgi:hypothetical protein